MDACLSFGCLVCFLENGVRGTPAELHHILDGGRRIGHLWSLPLCTPGHHRSPATGKIARHPFKARFESTYGTEAELLAKMRALLGWNGKLSRSPSKIVPRRM